MATARELRRRVQPLVRSAWRRPFCPKRAGPPAASPGYPGPERAETQHTIVSGTTGSGKTVLISDLVSQIRKRGERCILYDKMGTYTRSFFVPARDVLMNPLDARAPLLVPLLRGEFPPGLRHDGGRPHPPAEGHGGPLLGHGGQATLRQRRRRALEAGGDPRTGSSSTTCSRPT